MRVPGSVADPAMAPTQAEVDAFVHRIRRVVSAYKDSPGRLDRLSRLYAMLTTFFDTGTYGIALGELAALEKAKP